MRPPGFGAPMVTQQMSSPNSSPPPTILLQKFCARMSMPMPVYVYSNTQQGMSAMVMIGPKICFGGMLCSTKQEAAESAALKALEQLQQIQPIQAAAPMRFVQPMVAMPGLPQQQYQQLYRPQQQMMFRPAQPQPNPQASNSKPSNKGQQGHSTQEAGKQMSNPRGRSGSESSGNQDTSRQPEKKNPFIPHQAVMKSRSGQKSTTPQDVASPSKADNELKSLLGMTKPNPDVQGMTSPNAEDDIKTILGIDSKHPQPPSQKNQDEANLTAHDPRKFDQSELG